jgi:hypothetical protein
MACDIQKGKHTVKYSRGLEDSTKHTVKYSRGLEDSTNFSSRDITRSYRPTYSNTELTCVVKNPS